MERELKAGKRYPKETEQLAAEHLALIQRVLGFRNPEKIIDVLIRIK